jgi:hypothetical protein
MHDTSFLSYPGSLKIAGSATFDAKWNANYPAR